jgi:predicted ATP-dependent endonuclease of OLD family
MRLKSVFVRFYKSFNYDYLRKIKADSVDRKPWESVNGQFYPYVEVPIDQKITTIVGANESGKSHLLTAIEKGLKGKSEHTKSSPEITRKDFCRYSHFFNSIVGGPSLPDFGFEWVDIEDSLDEVCKLCELKEDRKFDRFLFFRQGGDKCTFYLPKTDENGFDAFPVPEVPDDFFPHIFRIDSDIALPDSIPIANLIKGRYEPDELWQPSGREAAYLATDAVPRIQEYLNNIFSLGRVNLQGYSGFPLPDNLHAEANELKGLLNNSSHQWRDDERRRKALEFNLAYDLIFEIAKIDVSDIKMMNDALRKGESGLVRAVVNNINEALKFRLNFPRVWAQDRNFALRVEVTEHELSFLISDRTGREYSFEERSSGLKHFLSYYIQYLTHKPKGSSEILLMDEPDAFLSGEAQQDLLKVFQKFADPDLGRGSEAVPVQVIYVTHSPFLIDKNHSERVRALEKAEGAKGTRVISGAAQNHYEPLRSAFGSFVGETTFISGCNLMVEGPADQILLAGSAAYLRKLENVPESQLLDLNRITIVPAGGGMSVPYLVYLARGRDAEKPAVIVILDSDSEGDRAKLNLSKNGSHPNNKRVLDPNFILQLGEILQSDIEKFKVNIKPLDNKDNLIDENPFKVLEDLVPLPLAVRAVRNFVKTIYVLQDNELELITEEAIRSKQKPGEPVFAAIQSVLNTLTPEGEVHIDKVPFARTVVDLLPELANERQKSQDFGIESGLDEFEANMRSVFYHLSNMQKLAEQDVKDKRMKQKVEQKILTFLSDHTDSNTASRDDAFRLLRDIESDLDGDDTVRAYIVQKSGQLRSKHNLTEDPVEKIRDFTAFCDGLEILRNANDYAYETTILEVPSRKNSKTPKETLDQSLNSPSKDLGDTLDRESTKHTDNVPTGEDSTLLDDSPPTKQKKTQSKSFKQ